MQARLTEQSLGSTFIEVPTYVVGKMVVLGRDFPDNKVEFLGDNDEEKFTEK